MKATRLMAGVISILALCAMGWAQFSSSVQGTVRDSSGATVAQAKVHLRDQATGVVKQVVTNAEGFYRFNSLPIGKYRVTVDAEGFKSQTIDVEVTANQSRDVDVTMAVGSDQPVGGRHWRSCVGRHDRNAHPSQHRRRKASGPSGAQQQHHQPDEHGSRRGRQQCRPRRQLYQRIFSGHERERPQLVRATSSMSTD